MANDGVTVPANAIGLSTGVSRSSAKPTIEGPAVPPADLCANCSAPLTGPYCAACGQSRDVHRHSLGHLLVDTVKHIANWDGRLMRIVPALLFHPGELAVAACGYRAFSFCWSA